MGVRGRAGRCRRGGDVTGGTGAPVLRKNIALWRMDLSRAAPGREVEVGKIDGHQKRNPAAVVRWPFYDPDKTRVRA
jgi:aminomethyltransferase